MPGVFGRIFTGVGAQAKILGRQASAVASKVAHQGVAAGWQSMKTNPLLYRTAIGAGIGAVSGGVYAGTTDRSVLGGTLVGAGLGAGAGFGSGVYKRRSTIARAMKSGASKNFAASMEGSVEEMAENITRSAGTTFSNAASNPVGSFSPVANRTRNKVLRTLGGRRYRTSAQSGAGARYLNARRPKIGANSPYQQRYTAPVFNQNSYANRLRNAQRGRRR